MKGLKKNLIYLSLGIVLPLSFQASKVNAATANASCQQAYKAMQWIVLVGWAIYPIGYVMGYMTSSASPESLNIIYNLADFINKIGFGLVIWAAAKKDSEASA